MNALGLDGVLVINVRAFTERRAHVEAELQRFQIASEFVHDFDIGDITPEIDAAWFQGQLLNMAQKSCALKHVEALRRIRDRGWQRALVLEDDVVLAEDFVEGVHAALREATAQPRPHIVYIGCGGNFYTPRSRRVAGVRLYRGTRGRFGDSYILGAAEAQLRLDWIERNRLTTPIDNAFDRMDPELGIAWWWLEDPVVEQGSKRGMFHTTLEDGRSDWVQALHFRWEKFRRKYLYQLWR